MKSWYEVLEVHESASAEQIRSAYLRMAREYHPDRVPEHLTKLRADAEDKFKQVQEAWTVLGDPARRRRYDLASRRQDVPRSTSPAQPPSQTTHHPAANESFRDASRRRLDIVKWALLVLIVKWALLVLIVTPVLVVIGEVVVSRESSNAPATTGAAVTKLATTGNASDIHGSKAHPHRIQTWRGEGGHGLDVHLVSAISRSDELEVTFLVRAGEHGDLLLYEPPGASGHAKKIMGKEVIVDRDFGEPYVEDDTGAKYIATTGLVGGEQANFNLYNFTRRINFKPHEEVVLSVKFPPVARHSSSITFVSPGLGKWQPEWRWPEISLK